MSEDSSVELLFSFHFHGGLWLELGSPVLSVTIAFIHQARPFSGPLFKELTV